MDRRDAAHIRTDDRATRELLEQAGFRIINPWRDEIEDPLDSYRIVEANRALLLDASALAANLSVERYPYVGIWFEIAQAAALRIPVVSWVGSTGYERHHYLRTHCEFIVDDAQSAVDYLRYACTDDGVARLLDEAKIYYDAIADRYQEINSQVYPSGRDRHYDAERAKLALKLEEWCRGKTVLELGCGDGEWTAAIARSARQIVCVDASRAMLDQARLRLASAAVRPEFVQCDLFDASMSFGGCAVIVAFFLLGFMPRRAQAKLLRRILKSCDPGTIVIFAESVRQGDVASKGLDAVRLQPRTVDGRQFVICKEVFSAGALASRASAEGFHIVEEVYPASWFSCCIAAAGKQ
jgi:SAM-dependent methyltransferase